LTLVPLKDVRTLASASLIVNLYVLDNVGVPPILFRDTIISLAFVAADGDQYAIGFRKTP